MGHRKTVRKARAERKLEKFGCRLYKCLELARQQRNEFEYEIKEGDLIIYKDQIRIQQ